jgi:hypothetical protein
MANEMFDDSGNDLSSGPDIEADHLLNFDDMDEDGRQTGRRAWKRISNHDRMKMIISVELGLSGHFAGKIINSRSCNAARMIKE